MFKKLVTIAASLLVAASLSLVGVAGSASALGQPGTSDGPIPHSVTTTTLALTGTDDLGWLVLAVILLRIGVGALAVRFAVNRRRLAQHRAD